MAHEAGDDMIGVVGIADGVGPAKQHLETDVGNLGAKLAKAFPWVLVEETHRRVERGPAPHLQRKQVGGAAGERIRAGQHVMGADTGGHERLMGVAESRVGDEQALLGDRPLGEFLRAELKEQLARAIGRVQLEIAGGHDRRNERLGGTIALGVGIAVDDDVADEVEELGGAIVTGLEAEELGRSVDQRGRGLPRAEDRVGDDVLEEGNIGLHAADAEFAQHAAHALEGQIVALAAGNDLHQHGVVKRRDDRARETHRAVKTHAETAGRAIGLDATVVGHEFILGILGGDAALEGKTVARYVRLMRHGHFRRVQRMPLGDENLGAHEVEAGDDLGHGMLDLDAGIHLDEKPLVAVEIVEKLHRAGVVVADLAGDAHGGVAKIVDDGAGQAVAGSDLDHLLMAALHGTVALVKMDDVAMLVPENLHLDVLGARDVFFEEHGGVAESAVGLSLRLVKEVGEIGGLVDDAHAATAAAEGRLDDEGKADDLGDTQGLGAVGNGFLGAGENGDVDTLGERAGGGLVTHHVEQLGTRTDKDNAGLFTGAGEIGILGEEPVAGVNRVDALGLGDANHALDVEIGGDRALSATDLIRFIGFVTMDRETVLLRKHRHGAQPELGARTENTHGDFGSVGGHQFLDGADRDGGR